MFVQLSGTKKKRNVPVGLLFLQSYSNSTITTGLISSTNDSIECFEFLCKRSSVKSCIFAYAFEFSGTQRVKESHLFWLIVILKLGSFFFLFTRFFPSNSRNRKFLVLKINQRKFSYFVRWELKSVPLVLTFMRFQTQNFMEPPALFFLPVFWSTLFEV